jgi:hypothetical protein
MEPKSPTRLMTDFVSAEPSTSSIQDKAPEPDMTGQNIIDCVWNESLKGTTHLNEIPYEVLLDGFYTVMDLRPVEDSSVLCDVSVGPAKVVSEDDEPFTVPARSPGSMEAIATLTQPQPVELLTLIRSPDSQRRKRTRRKTITFGSVGPNPYGRMGKRRCVQCRKWRQKAGRPL